MSQIENGLINLKTLYITFSSKNRLLEIFWNDGTIKKLKLYIYVWIHENDIITNVTTGAQCALIGSKNWYWNLYYVTSYIFII